MRITQTFVVGGPAERVFDYMTDPANLREWQTSKTWVEPLDDGPPRQGYRVREWTKPPGMKEFEQVVEFAEFDRPLAFAVHVVEGPFPIAGSWSLSPVAAGTQVEFVAEGELRGLMRLAGPIVERMVARQFAAYHERLRRNVESLGGNGTGPA